MKKIKVVDLFSGAGGLTYGFTHKICGNKIIKNDKFTITFANEIDENTAKTFKTNFPEIRLLECDISKINESYLSKNDIDFTNIDLVIGGPPCQSFSTIGKRCYDERAKMYLEYRRILSIISPKIFIFENVVGLLSMKDDEGNKVIENIKKMFSSFKSSNKNIGYDLQIKVLDMKDFGIPQSRKRVFIVGIKKGLNVK
jgi:DNA (cytosine-5)-methyltransferase 1